MVDRIQADGYSYIPTQLNRELKPGEQLAYESLLEQGKDYHVNIIQGIIDGLKERGFSVENLQAAFNQVAPLVLVGDLVIGESDPVNWHGIASKKLETIKASPKKKYWLNRLVNNGTGLHTLVDENGVKVLNSVFLPAIDKFLDNLI